MCELLRKPRHVRLPALLVSYFQHDVYTEKHYKNPIFYCKMLAGNAAVAFDFQLNYD